ncbi:MAG: clan AA aspartic protease [Deltaproteobacteria bacterium]|nr:clan AA aspartic protease [Deltaproteobacteria bacterium]
MITGHIVDGREARIPLSLLGSQGQVEATEAVIDTGFTDFLTLPLPQIARLGFSYEGMMQVILGNGQSADLDMFTGTVVWDGQIREGLVLAVDGTPLVGMALLTGSRVCLDVTNNGLVTIDRLP